MKQLFIRIVSGAACLALAGCSSFSGDAVKNQEPSAPEAQYAEGLRLLAGEAKDLPKAKICFKNAMEKGHPEAEFQYWKLTAGEGGREAVPYFQKHLTGARALESAAILGEDALKHFDPKNSADLLKYYGMLLRDTAVTPENGELLTRAYGTFQAGVPSCAAEILKARPPEEASAFADSLEELFRKSMENGIAKDDTNYYYPFKITAETVSDIGAGGLILCPVTVPCDLIGTIFYPLALASRKTPAMNCAQTSLLSSLRKEINEKKAEIAEKARLEAERIARAEAEAKRIAEEKRLAEEREKKLNDPAFRYPYGNQERVLLYGDLDSGTSLQWIEFRDGKKCKLFYERIDGRPFGFQEKELPDGKVTLIFRLPSDDVSDPRSVLVEADIVRKKAVLADVLADLSKKYNGTFTEKTEKNEFHKTITPNNIPVLITGWISLTTNTMKVKNGEIIVKTVDCSVNTTAPSLSDFERLSIRDSFKGMILSKAGQSEGSILILIKDTSLPALMDQQK